MHVEDAADDEYRPARQSSHVEEEVAPTVVLCLPLGKWGGIWGVLARIEENGDFSCELFFWTKVKIPGLVGNAATHLAHSVQPLKLNGVPETDQPEVLRLVPWVP